MARATRTEYLSRLKTERLPPLASPVARLSDAALGGLLDDALLLYSGQRPRITSADIPGAGSATLTLPNGTLYTQAPAWVPEFSGIRDLEVPAGSDMWLDPETFWLSPRHGVPTAVVLESALAVGTTARLFYTVVHTATDLTASVPSADEPVLLHLFARAACVAMAAAVSDAKDPLIAADAINYRDLAARYQSLARDYDRLLPTAFQQLRTVAGGPDGAVAPASGWVDWDVKELVGSAAYVWRGARTR